MATASIQRTDDTSATLKNIATVSFSEDAVTKHAQQCVIVDASTPTQKQTVDSNGDAGVILAANSGVDIGDVTLNAGTAEIGKLAAGTAGIGKLTANSGVDIGDVTLTAGTAAFGKLAANSGVDIGDVDVTSVTGLTFLNAGAQVTGDEAHSATDAGNPVKIGARAVEVSATPAEVDAAERTDLLANRQGMLHVIGGGMDTFSREAVVLDSDGAQTATSLLTVAAGTSIVVTSIQVHVDEACTVGVSVRIGFGTASLPAEATTGTAQALFHHAGIVPGGGANKGDGSGILGIGATNEDLRYTTDDPVGGELSIIVTGFTIAI